MVHILPHWNWEGREGQNIPVLAYTNADEVELFLNGKSLGRKKHGQDTVVIPVGDNISKDHKYTTKYRWRGRCLMPPARSARWRIRQGNRWRSTSGAPLDPRHKSN